jgi:Carboxypeptidase regulatory-like domain
MLHIRIASPCPADWERMRGDDRVRHCQECNLNVYNLSALSEREIRELVANNQGRLCGRLYRRHDGTMITRNCPAGLKAIGRRISRIAGAILSLAIPSLTAATPTLAQSYSHTNLGSAGVSLQVMDPSGAFISEATVTLDDLARNHTIHGMADKNGRALLWAPLGGSYRLRVSAPSMQTFTREVELRSGQILSLPVKLDVGALTGLVVIESISRPDRESIPVSAPSPIIRSGPGAMQN